jgi:hypothetical protein
MFAARDYIGKPERAFWRVKRSSCGKNSGSPQSARTEQGRALVETEYSFDVMLGKLDAIYRKYLSPA